ncbi:unnamed protein product [Closterium sp. Naga37s-1]|nr:unnamed protein product [Closterium sp. Naga37s-1]
MEKLRREAKSVNRGPALRSRVKIKSEAGEAWGLSPRGWGEVQSALRAAETSPSGPEPGQLNSEERGNLGLGGDRRTAPSPLQLADTPARSAGAAELRHSQQGRWGALWSQTHEYEPLPPPLEPPALHPPPYSPRGQPRSLGRDYPRAQNYSSAHDVRQSQPTEDGAGRAPCDETPNGPREPRGPDAEVTAAATADGGTAAAGSVFPATSEESGSGGRGAEDPADNPPTAAATHARRGRGSRSSTLRGPTPLLTRRLGIRRDE